MRENRTAGFLFVLLIALEYLLQAQFLPVPEGRRLRDIVEDKYTDGWNWSRADATGWKPERIPAMFDTNYHPKPAYRALQYSLESGVDHTATLGARIKNNSEEINLFPNPTSDWMDIQSNTDFSTIEIINVSGITVDHFHLEESSNRIDISQLRMVIMG